MTRFRAAVIAMLVFGLAASVAGVGYAARSDGDKKGGHQVLIRDDCDPSDAEWNQVGGCTLKRGDVSFAEFNGELDSPLAAAVIGHQSWRNDPSYLEIKAGKTVHGQKRGRPSSHLHRGRRLRRRQGSGSAAQRRPRDRSRVSGLDRHCTGRASDLRRPWTRQSPFPMLHPSLDARAHQGERRGRSLEPRLKPSNARAPGNGGSLTSPSLVLTRTRCDNRRSTGAASCG